MKETVKKIFELSKANSKTTEEISLKMVEELGEIAEATLGYKKSSGSDYKGKGKEDILEELVDLQLIALSLMVRAEMIIETKEDLREFMKEAKEVAMFEVMNEKEKTLERQIFDLTGSVHRVCELKENSRGQFIHTKASEVYIESLKIFIRLKGLLDFQKLQASLLNEKTEKWYQTTK